MEKPKQLSVKEIEDALSTALSQFSFRKLSRQEIGQNHSDGENVLAMWERPSDIELFGEDSPQAEWLGANLSWFVALDMSPFAEEVSPYMPNTLALTITSTGEENEMVLPVPAFDFGLQPFIRAAIANVRYFVDNGASFRFMVIGDDGQPIKANL